MSRIAAKAAGAAAAGASVLLAADQLERLSLSVGIAQGLSLRSSRLQEHRVDSSALPEPVTMSIRSMMRYGIDSTGTIEWPGGRVLLQYLMDTLPLDKPGTVLEVGSGVGTTAIGLALAAGPASAESGSARRLNVVASDCDEAACSVLRENAERNGVASLPVVKWDAASDAVLPIAVDELTHLIGADVVYYGGADDTDADDASTSKVRGLAGTLAVLLAQRPSLEVVLLCTERFPAEHTEGRDAALLQFERRCVAHGLHVTRQPVPAATERRVREAQSLAVRGAWWVSGMWESLWLYHVSLPRGSDEASFVELGGRTPSHRSMMFISDEGIMPVKPHE